MRADEQAAWQALDAARMTLDHHDQKPPCSGRWHEFTADSADTLRDAAELCAGCPILAACAGVVPFVFHGAWAGVVRLNGKAVSS